MVKKICGEENTLYLVFLRYSFKFFALVSIVNIGFLWLYVTGVPKADDDFRLDTNTNKFPMQAFTILNVTATMPKVWVSFLNSIITMAALGIYFLYLYMNKFKNKVGRAQMMKQF